MRIYTIKWFQRFVRKEGISDRDLSLAVARADHGSIDADPGGGLIKQRVARRGGGYRTLIAFRSGDRSVFIFGFAKNAKDNISQDDLKRLRKAAAEVLGFSDETIAQLIADGKWTEVHCDE